MKIITFLHRIIVLVITFMGSISFSQDYGLKDHLIFYSSFDGKAAADFAVGDAEIYTAISPKEIAEAKPGLLNPDVELATGKGFVGDALNFKKKSKMITFYKGKRNMGYNRESWSGTVSFWLQLDPEKDLEPGYCDPIQITDVTYNDAALWVDFTKDNPRDFRLGVIGDIAVWNPEKKDEQVKMEKRLVRVKEPPFHREGWTHVVMRFSQLNTNGAKHELFINGESKGAVEGISDSFTWDEERSRIMLGLNYIGLMDEITIFNKALDKEAVKAIYRMKNGIKSILN
ncbi:hypothetical protein [Maribacter sp. 2304DJ31-5]|uniref:hypothetical protein n=1 Tax=Maribacter sp. 2304DJ31-5 TaxID=3386273 RepID=UPI0039BC310D